MTIEIRDLGTLAGAWDPDTRTIYLHSRLTSAARRCTLMHELIHAARGDEPCADHVLDARQERLVNEMAAILLIPIEALADCITWCRNTHELCEALDVDHDTLETRLRYLSSMEQGYLRARIERVEQIA